MATLTSVKQLIQSLSKAEKRSFKLFSSLLEGEKDYMKLYDILADPKTTSESAADSYKLMCSASEIDATCNYLYIIIIKSLKVLNQKIEIDDQLLSDIQEVRILFRKGLSEQGFRLLEKLRKTAMEYEKFAYALIIDKMLLHYQTRFQFKGLTESELIKIQNRLRKNISYELNLADHSALYELLYHRYLIDGVTRSQKEKEKLNDLVVSEMNIAGNPRYQSFELKKNHLLFQSVYFMMTGDHKSSLGTYYELSILFEENMQLWNNPPISYINHIRGILNNLHATGQYSEMDFFIGKLKKLEKDNRLISIRQSIYCAELKMFMGLKNYASAFNIIESNTEFTVKAIQLTSIDRAEVIFYTSICYIIQKQFHKAANILSNVIHLENLENDQLRRELRLINLIVHFHLHDYNYLLSEIRSLERELKQNKKNYLTEKIIFNLIKKYPLALSRSTKNKLVDHTMEQLHLLVESSYEKHLFRVFDFVEWIKSIHFDSSS